MYLKTIIKKITKNKEHIQDISKLQSDKEVIDYLLKEGFSFEEIITVFENHYSVKHINLNDIEIGRAVESAFDFESLVKKEIMPYKENKAEQRYYFTMYNIFKEDLKDYIRSICKSKGYDVDFGFSFDFEIQNKYQNLKEKKKETEKDSGIKEIRENNEDFNAKGWFEDILNEGISKKASDIHIEILEENLRVRYRIDGVLTNTCKYDFTASEIANITVRIKILAALDIAEKRKPQDGRIDNFVYKPNGEKYDFRVSSVNTLYGEKFVLRLFKKTTRALTYKELGFSEEDSSQLGRLLNNPNGIIYMAGATGSGKTTTLYSMIDQLNTEEVNIYTIEDPIEKTTKGINQIQIDVVGGVTYASTLRALLRQDPDVIVVGEIRDTETAELAIQASLTGHLVLTTIHANNAIESISRLFDMGIEPYLLSASSLSFMSQRLVRLLCPHCKEKVESLKPFEEEWLKKTLQENNEPYNINDFKEVYRPVGCSKCNGGYSGRTAIIEIVEVDELLRDAISKNITLNEMKQIVLNKGFKSLSKKGVDLIKNSKSSIAEVMKVL